MRTKKTPSTAPPPPVAPSAYRLIIWLGFVATSLFFIPQCLDRYLVSRFFLLSAVLLLCLLLIRKDLKTNGDWRLNGFDMLMLAWYALNLASVSWAFSWSEGIFYTQKVSLLFLYYWLVRQALHRDEAGVWQALRQAVTVLSFAAGGIIVVQLGLAVSQYGLNNEHLYDYASGVFGNKNLASDFLFFLLVLNLLRHGKNTPSSPPVVPLMLSLLIILLQTRTVYLALAAVVLVYFPFRAVLDPAFKGLFRKKILPAGVLMLGLLIALATLKGTGTLAERLNPLTYLESQTASERRFVWYKTDLLNADHPWLGVGNGSWKIWFPSKNIEGSYRLQGQNIVFTRAHNDYLEVRSEMGIVGVVLFCLLFAAAFWAVFSRIRDEEAPFPVRHDLLVLSCGLLGYCIIQFFDFPRERIEMQVVLAIFFAGVIYLTMPRWKRWPGVSISKVSDPFIWLFALTMAFNLLVGWNRIQGEVHNVRILQAQVKGNYKAMIAETAAAKNRFYEYNDVALPLDWYSGIGYYQSGDIPHAIEDFEQAYRLNPWSFQVINNYASALVGSKRFREAIPLYKKALEINPRFDEGKFNMAFVLFNIGERDKALEWLERIEAAPPGASATERQKSEDLLKRKAEFIRVIGNSAK